MTLTFFRFPRRPAVMLAAALLAAGCTPLGAILYKITPEQEIPAKFTLANVPTVVLVENYRNPDIAANDAELVARYLQSELTSHKDVKITLVKTEKILDLRNNRPKDFPTMSIPQIAKAVGAEQVVYVDLQGANITSLTGQSMFQGKASAAIKVIDAKTGMSTFPPDSVDGMQVTYETSQLKGQEEGSYNVVRDDLYSGLATKIGRNFHVWKQSEDDDKDK